MGEYLIKNNLKNLILEKGISKSELSKKTRLDKGTIRKIVNNEFHDMKMTTVIKLINALEVDWGDLISKVTEREVIYNYLIPYSFNEKNKELLRKKVYEFNPDFNFEIEPYSKGNKANLYLKNKKLGIDIDINITVFWTVRGVTLTILDFDIINNKKISFEKYKRIYKEFLISFELYAFDINVDVIRFCISNYQNPIMNNKLILPIKMSDSELNAILEQVDEFYDMNEILKWNILLDIKYKKIYEIFNGRENLSYKKYQEADNYFLRNQNISIYEREKKRQQFYNASGELSNDRYLYKIINENSKNKVLIEKILCLN